MALWTSYDQVGKKEDVSDIISNISPTKVPFQTSIGTEKVNNTIYQWQEDSLASAGANAQVDGFTASDATLTATTMRSNYTQILQKTIKVSGTADAVSTYGRAKESAYQMAKAAAEVKRDLEYAMVGRTQAATQGSAGTARQFAAVTNLIDSNNKVKTGGTTTAMSEANLLTAMQKLYDAGVEADICLVTSNDALTIADFAKASGSLRQRDMQLGTKLVNAVDVYVSPFGEVKVVIDRFLLAGDTILYAPDMWKQAVLRPWFRETLAKDGDNTKMMIAGEFGLMHKNFLASAYIRREA